MLRRGLYIIILLLLSAHPLHTYAMFSDGRKALASSLISQNTSFVAVINDNDTTKVKRIPQNHIDLLSGSTIKEVPKPKRQPKPEKIATPADTSANNNKPRSKRRPEGVERPPDIIRRNNN
jgi:hypothetical protein